MGLLAPVDVEISLSSGFSQGRGFASGAVIVEVAEDAGAED